METGPRPTKFYLNDDPEDDRLFDGWKCDEYWNGWEMPFFTHETMTAILTYLTEEYEVAPDEIDGPARWEYDEVSKVFRLWMQEDPEAWIFPVWTDFQIDGKDVWRIDGFTWTEYDPVWLQDPGTPETVNHPGLVAEQPPKLAAPTWLEELRQPRRPYPMDLTAAPKVTAGSLTAEGFVCAYLLTDSDYMQTLRGFISRQDGREMTDEEIEDACAAFNFRDYNHGPGRGWMDYATQTRGGVTFVVVRKGLDI